MTTLTIDLSYRNPETDALESNPDSTPNAFTIAPQTGVALDSLITSAPITVTGYVTAPISVSGGQYNIDGGALTSSPGTINLGQIPRVRVQSGDGNSEETSATLTIGGVSADFVVTTLSGSAVLLSRLDLSGGVPNGDGPGLWGFGKLSDANLTVVNDGTNTYLRGEYPADSGGSGGSGATYIWGGYVLEDLQQELYVTIYARMPGPYREGCKFCKFFGQRLGDDYANTTFATDYTGTDLGSRQYIAWGDGTFDQNDDGNGVGLDEAYPINTGRNGPLTKTIEHGGSFDSTEWGSGWHKWQIRARFNSGTTSGNEINDGAYEEHIDGVMRAKAINVFSRNPINAFYDSVQFFGYARGATEPWEIHIRDITVSLNGWVD